MPRVTLLAGSPCPVLSSTMTPEARLPVLVVLICSGGVMPWTMAAGHMQHTGTLFFLLPRQRPAQHAGVMPLQTRRQSTHPQAPGRIHGTLTQ